ncbi:MAG: cytochrome c peroxidase [Pirellulales bacterium]
MEHGRQLSRISLACSVWWLLTLSAAAQVNPGADDEPQLVPLPVKVPAPRSDPTTPEKVALGKQLFFDPRLSGDNTNSCATCHAPEKAFGDGLATGKGRNGKPLRRNTPSLLNVGLYSSFFWDGRAGSLEEQALAPIESPHEMNQKLDELEQELGAVHGYVEQFQQVFGTKPTRDVIVKALAAFERSLVTGPSPFDKYLAGERDALSKEAKRGLELFVGDAGCVRCHSGPLLSDSKFYRLGISTTDRGREEVTRDEKDRMRFRTPSLRNIAETAPYMHDGSLATLTSVVEFYYRGVTPVSSPLAPEVESLQGRSYSEVSDLVAFLESLSGEPPKIKRPTLP